MLRLRPGPRTAFGEKVLADGSLVMENAFGILLIVAIITLLDRWGCRKDRKSHNRAA